MSDYLAYQDKYRDTPRDSDRELIRLISERVPQGGRVLDVGCSTGNLLRHLRAARPDLILSGVDVDPAAVASTAAAGFPAAEWDIASPYALPGDPEHDAVILNAVLYCLTDLEAERALRNIYRLLRPGGHLFIWDLLHPWNQRLTITEETERYGQPTFHVRPFTLLADLATEAGFTSFQFLPQIQPPLPEPDDPDDMTSWTQDGISFRGGIAQPWCHAILTR